jgi:hypothetical protein
VLLLGWAREPETRAAHPPSRFPTISSTR